MEGQDERAIKLMNSMQARYPIASQPYAMLGDIYLAQGKYDLAKHNLRIAVQLEQGDSQSLFQLAQIALQFDARDDAVEYLRKSVQADPHNFPARVMLARLLWATGKIDEALLEYNSACAQDSQNAVLLGELSTLLWLKGRALDAIEKLHQAYRLDPESAEIQKQYLTIYGARRDWPNAVDAAKSWTQLEPKNPSAHVTLGWTLMMTQEFDDAAAALKDAITLAPEDEEAHNIYGIIQAERRRFDDAISQFKASIALNPNYLPAHLNLAAGTFFKGQSAEALEQLKKLELKYPGNLSVLSLQAFISCRSGSQIEAENLCKEALAIDQFDPLALISKGILCRRQGQLDESSRILQRVSKQIPESSLSLVEYSNSLLKEGKGKQAIEIAQQALQVAPSNLEAKAALAFALAHEKNYDGAILLMKECVVRNAKDLSLRMALANTQIAKGDVEFAESTLDKAKILFPNRPEPLIVLSELASKAHNYKLAESYLDEALILAPQNQQILILLARLSFAQGKPAACLDRLSTLNDNDLATSDLLLKARSEFILKDYAAAASDYDKIANLRKTGSSEDIVNFARSLLESGQPARAQDLLRTVQADPELAKQCKQAQIEKLHSDLKAWERRPTRGF